MIKVETVKDPKELEKGCKKVLNKVGAWMKHPRIDHNKMVAVGWVQNTKEGVHSTKPFQDKIFRKMVEWFNSNDHDKQFNENLTNKMTNWETEMYHPVIEIVYSEVKGVKANAEMMEIRTTNLHYPYVSAMLTFYVKNNQPLFGNTYKICTNNMKKDLIKQTNSFAQGFNKFDCGLLSHNHKSSSFHVITIISMPTGFKDVILTKQEGLPPGSLNVTSSNYLRQHSSFVSLETTEEKGKFHIVLLPDLKKKTVEI